jgi:RNA polymerase sigma-70 factor (ECF subfamily)
MLGSMSEAEDAVQDTWLRLSRSDASQVQNMGGWLTTVVARVCLNVLRSRRSHGAEPAGSQLPGGGPYDAGGPDDAGDPEQQAILAESVGVALLVVMDRLTPSERLAFVLHDMFDVPFDEIAPIVDRSPAATRQLASRARQRLRGRTAVGGNDPGRRREVVEAFLAASREGDFDALLAVLDPEVVLRADQTAARLGAAAETVGARTVAGFFFGRARGARLALIDGSAGAVWAPGGRPKVVLSFAISDGMITAIDLVADPERLDELELSFPG